MPTLADIYSMIDSAKRRGTDFIRNPGTNLQQMVGNANDKARAFNELNDAALDEFRATGDLYGPKGKELAQTLAGAYNPVGMINQPIKGAKLVNIPVDMIEHGEAVMPGGTLTFSGARKKIEEYAKKETPIPPIDVVSAESGKPWMVADGSHRLEAAKLKGAKTIPAYVSPHDKEGLEQIAKYKMVAKEAEMPVQKVEDVAYRGQHTAPGPDFGAPLHDLTGGGQMYPSDVYSENALRFYGTGFPAADREAFDLAKRVRGNPSAEVTMYRAVPKDESIKSINKGDWVTLSKQYAKNHGESVLKNKYKIISQKVKAKDLWTNADSIHEFGYHPE